MGGDIRQLLDPDTLLLVDTLLLMDTILLVDMLLPTPALPALHRAASMEGILQTLTPLMVPHTSTETHLHNNTETHLHTSTEIHLHPISSQEHLKDTVTAAVGGRFVFSFQVVERTTQSLQYHTCKVRG